MRFGLGLFAVLIVLAQDSFAATALDTVNKTNTMRCGYVSYEPALVKDQKSGAWSGFDYDIIEAVGRRLELKAEWNVPTGFATVVPDLNTHKFDVFCTGFWVHPNVAKFANFSRPVFYQPVFVVTRANEKRITDKASLNNKVLKMVALDGDNPIHIAHIDFPKAQILALPNMTDFSQVLVNVADGKADFTIVDAFTFGTYNKNNPGKLKIMSPDKPIRTYPVSYVFGAEDTQFRDAFNAALDELILDGTIDTIMDKYDFYPNTYYRAIVPHK